MASPSTEGARLTRREALARTGSILGAGALALGRGAPVAAARPKARLGITGGTQPVWRYLAARKAELLEGPLGYDLEFRIFPSDAAMRIVFLAGDLEGFTTLIPEAPALIEQKVDVQFFLPIAWVRETGVFAVRRESGIKSLAEARGRKIATSPLRQAGLAYFRAFVLANHGFKLEEHMDLLQVNTPDVPLEAGQSDGAYISSVHWVRLKDSGKYVRITSLGDEWARISQSPRLLAFGGVLARRKWIEENRKLVEGLIGAAAEAQRHLGRNRAEFLEIVRNYDADGSIKKQTPEQAAFSIWSFGHEDVGPERVHLTRQDVEDFRLVFSLLEKSGYLKAPPPAETIFYLSQPRSGHRLPPAREGGSHLS
ncbi:MAG: ABC transporter substrate-binding protein [Candidatus Rokuibacteriota bacterium]